MLTTSLPFPKRKWGRMAEKKQPPWETNISTNNLSASQGCRFFFLINDKILCSQSGAVKAFTSSETLCATHLNERNKDLSLKKFPKTCSIGYTIIIFCYLKHWANSYNLGFWKENSIYFKQENRNKAFFPPLSSKTLPGNENCGSHKFCNSFLIIKKIIYCKNSAW